MLSRGEASGSWAILPDLRAFRPDGASRLPRRGSARFADGRERRSSDRPVIRRAPVIVQFALALPIRPLVLVPVAVEARGAAQLLLGDVGPIAAQTGVVGELAPGNGVLFLTHAQE